MIKKMILCSILMVGLLCGNIPPILMNAVAEQPAACTPEPTEPITPGANESNEVVTVLLPCEQTKSTENKFDQDLLKLLDEHTMKLEEAKRQAIEESLKGEMQGEIELFYDRSIELGLDPVYVVALAAWETGDGTSNICVNKHNFGGMRSGGEWTRFESKEAGIEAFINLLVSYAEKGLETPEKMATRYAPGSDTWAPNVRKIMKRINDAITKKQDEVNQIYAELIREKTK